VRVLATLAARDEPPAATRRCQDHTRAEVRQGSCSGRPARRHHGRAHRSNDPGISTRLLLPAYAALENLTHGRADDDDFIRQVKFNLFGYELSARLWQYGNA